MRIALYASRAFPKIGGYEIVLDSLAREFVGAGHDVMLIAPRPKWWTFPDDSALPISSHALPSLPFETTWGGAIPGLSE